MFAKKTYREGRWIDRILRIASPVEGEEYWLRIPDQYLVRIKRQENWKTIKYVRKACSDSPKKYRPNEERIMPVYHLECFEKLIRPQYAWNRGLRWSRYGEGMKVYRSSDIFIHNLAPPEK